MVGETPEQEPLPALVAAAAAGDDQAWDTLVHRFTRLLWAICRGYRLNPMDAADVVQVTWLRLMEHLSRIDDPNRLAGWLATTCRRECQAALRRSRRLEPVGEDAYLDRLTAATDGPEVPMMVAARDQELWRAFARLTERCQRVLRVLVVEVEDRPSYRAAAEVLDMPVGALGPTRGRCLEQLRRLLGEAA
jgi:RNA polymerase sigma factor (sigma-70 family)